MDLDVSMKLEKVDDDDWEAEVDKNEQIDFSIQNRDRLGALMGNDMDINVKIEMVEPHDGSINIEDTEITVKIEPVGSIEVTEDTMNIIKDEIDIGPTQLHRPNVSIVNNQIENTLDKNADENLFTEKKKRKTKNKSASKSPKTPKDTKEITFNHEKLDTALSCSLCSKLFYYTQNYSRHIKEYHNEITVKSLTCERCNKVFKRKYSLRRHQRSGVRCIVPRDDHSYICLCGRSYKNRSNLNRHATGYCERRKVNNGQYVCDLCGKVFPNRVRLSVHLSHHKRIQKT